MPEILPLLSDPAAWAALVTLVVMEVVLDARYLVLVAGQVEERQGVTYADIGRRSLVLGILRHLHPPGAKIRFHILNGNPAAGPKA